MEQQATPTVSVIVPNYNHARYLRRRIESILEQSYKDYELILLDDCSTDDSRKILNEYSAVARIETNVQNSGGVFKQWNKGVQMARGRYVWIAESDDYADSRFLERMVPILDGHTDVTFAFCRSWSVGEDDERLGHADSYLDRLDAYHWKADFMVDGLQECRHFFVLCDPIPNTSAVVWRKDIYERVGRADERFKMTADYMVWAAMALEGKIAYVAETLNYYRSHRNNVRTRTEAEALGVAEYFHAMLSIIVRSAGGVEFEGKNWAESMLAVPPVQLSALERIQNAMQTLEFITNWNLQNNSSIPKSAMREYFADWYFALVGQKFAISAPTRGEFFLHRCRYFREYFPRTSWKLRLTNFARMLGAPILGYQKRRWPEEVYSRAVHLWSAD